MKSIKKEKITQIVYVYFWNRIKRTSIHRDAYCSLYFPQQGSVLFLHTRRYFCKAEQNLLSS